MRHKGSCQWIICPTSAFKCFTFHRRKTVDGSIIHSLESAVIEWSHQIRAVLKKDSSEALLEGKSPTPHTELLFWNNRSGPVLLQTLHVHWRPLSSTCSVSWLYENKNTSSEDLQSWIVVFKVFAVANYSSFRRNTCAIKRKMWFGAHCFLFVLFFFVGYSRITPAEASIHYFYRLFLLLTCDKGLSVFHLFCSLDTCRFEMYPLLLPLISLTLAWRQYILIMY